MPNLPLTLAHYDREANYALPEGRLVNMLLEQAPTTTTGVARLPRPGLSASYSVGSGPIKGIFRQAGVFSGDIFTVSSATLYRGAASVGSVGVGDRFRFAASGTELVVVNTTTGVAYRYDGALAAIVPPGGELWSDVARLAARFIYSVQNSDRFYWSAVNDAISIDPLDFATAESLPDGIMALAVLPDELVFLGSGESTERWFPTGDVDTPFQKTTQGGYTKGACAQGGVLSLDNTLIWATNERTICRAGQVPTRISIPVIDAKLKACTSINDLTAFWFDFAGHDIAVFNIPGQGSYGYDLLSKSWSEWQSYGRTVFRGRCGVMVDGIAYLGDDQTGQVWTLDASAYTDNGTVITRIVSGYLKQPAGKQAIRNLALDCSRGSGLVSGAGSKPRVEERHSADAGQSWSDWRSTRLGMIGQYLRKAIWWGLGLAQSPGMHFEFRCTEPVKWVVSGATFGEPRP